MQKKLLSALALLTGFFLLSASILWADVESTFDSDLDGWTSNSSTGEVSWNDGTGLELGNPGGHIQFIDVDSIQTVVYAPSKFLGDWSDLDIIGFITFDHNIFDFGDGPVMKEYQINIFSPNSSATWKGLTANPDDEGVWLTIQAPLNESNWQVSSGSWDELLSNVTELNIHIELVGSGSISDKSGIDNVRLSSSIDLKDYDLTVWDFSGTYTDSRDNMTTLTYTLAQDSKGKLTGDGKLENLSGGDNMTIPVEIKGKVKGKVRVRVKDEVKETKSSVTVKYKVKGKNAEKDKIKNDLNLELEEDDETVLEGGETWMICQNGAGCEKTRERVFLPVPYGMTGEAMLSIDAELDDKGKKLLGDAELILSNDGVYPLVAKGKHNSKKGETKYQIKGDNKTTTKGIKFTIKMDEANNKTRTQIKGKAFGQKIDYKSK